jgi:AraC-like DNA-binding protein
MAEPTVAAGYARGLLELAVSRGADRTALLERSGIQLDQLLDQDHRIRFESYVALMRAGQDLCSDPALALHYGQAISIADVSIVGLIARASRTMAEAFAQVNRFAGLVIDVPFLGASGRFEIARRDGDTWMEDTRADPNAFPELTESTFARMVCGQAQDFGDISFARAIHVTHPAPGHRSEYERVFKMPVAFDSDRNALLLDERWLDIDIAPSNRYVFGIFSDRAAALLEELQRSRSLRHQVESLLMPVLHTGDVAMDAIAGRLGMSRQTLYRRLKEEGDSYDKIVDDLRHKLALHYLNGKKVSVSETAYLIGFSDPSAFSRAFTRWTGTSPMSFRRRRPDS